MSPTSGTVTTPEVAHFLTMIRQQADAEIAEITRTADQRVERTRAAAAADAAALAAAARSAGEARGRRRAAAILGEAETAGHREWLWARECLLEEVFKHVATRLEELPVTAETAAHLARLARAALAALPPGPRRLRVASRYTAPLATALAALPPTADDAEAPDRVEAGSITGGGVVAETDDARLCFDNSFATRLRLQRETLRRLAAAILFAE